MTGSRAAIRYAKAILEMAQSTGTSQQVNEDMELVASTISSNQELNDFINSPTTSGAAKLAALQEIFAGTQGITQRLFQLLESNQRFGVLKFIASEYKHQFDALNGVEEATVTTAFPITPELEVQVMNKIKEFSTKAITIRNIVDPAIIGGFILRLGDKQFNASVANSLLTLKRELSN